jgi:hypothetical protein
MPRFDHGRLPDQFKNAVMDCHAGHGLLDALFYQFLGPASTGARLADEVASRVRSWMVA